MLVVKLGGGAGMDIEACCDDIAALWQQGRRMVIVHGGADETTELGERLGHPARFVQSPNGMTSRYTDRETLEILAMACAGRRNVNLVEALQRRGVNAVGLSGVDGAVLQGPRKAAITVVENGRRMVLRDDHTGKVTRVNTHLLHLLLAGGYLPVLCPPAISEQHEAMNIDGDRAAAAVAAALDAETLVILSDVPGLLRNRADHGTLVPHLSEAEMDEAMTLATGSMRKKLLGAREALAGGVPRVILGLGRDEAPIQRALAGQGTVITGDTGGTFTTEAPQAQRHGGYTEREENRARQEHGRHLGLRLRSDGRDGADCGRLEEPGARTSSVPLSSMAGSGGTNVAFQGGIVQTDNMRPQSLAPAVQPQSGYPPMQWCPPDHLWSGACHDRSRSGGGMPLQLEAPREAGR